MRRLRFERLPDMVGAAGAISLIVASLGSGRSTLVLAALISAIAALLGLDMGRVVRAGGFALVALSVTTLVVGNLRPDFKIPSLNVVLLVGFFLAVAYLADSLPGRSKTGGRFLIGPSAISWLFFQNLLRIDRSGALARVAGDYAEDNAAWLLGLGKSSNGKSSFLSMSSNTGGGPSTGSFLVFVRDMSSRLAPDRVIGLADNPRVLINAYVLTAIASALLLSHLCEQATEHHSPWLRHSVSCLATATFIPFALSLMKVGHFSASVAVLFLVVAVTATMTTITEPPSSGTLKRSIAVGAALVAMGQAWYPLTGVAMLFIGLVVSHCSIQWWKRRAPSYRLLRIIPVGLVVTLVGIVVVRRFFPTYLGNITDLDYLRANLRLVGGYAPINPLLFVAASLGMLVSVSVVGRERSLLPYIVHATMFPLLVLLCISFLMTPNTPQYGVLKAIFILSSVFVPVSSAILVESLSRRLRRSVFPLASALMWCTVMFLSPPGNEVKWLSTPGSNTNDWAKAIIREADSGRAVVCLNTGKGDTGRDYEAYLCTRIASAVTVTDTYETRTWTAANICQIPPSQAKAAFTTNFQENLTVVIFDQTRLSSGAGCQAPAAGARAGWLSSIDWSTVRIVNTKGDPIVVHGGSQTPREGT